MLERRYCLSGIPADDFRSLSEDPALPAPLQRLHFAFGFFTGLLSRLMQSRQLRRQEALQRWTDQWRKWVARLVSGNTQSLDAAAPTTLAPLQAALIGQSRASVVITLGPPPATSSSESGGVVSRHYWHAETWYYPLDLNRRFALAITFQENLVKSI